MQTWGTGPWYPLGIWKNFGWTWSSYILGLWLFSFSFDFSLLGVFVWECACYSHMWKSERTKWVGSLFATCWGKMSHFFYAIYSKPAQACQQFSCLCSPSYFRSARITNVCHCAWLFFFFSTWVNSGPDFTHWANSLALMELCLCAVLVISWWAWSLA